MRNDEMGAFLTVSLSLISSICKMANQFQYSKSAAAVCPSTASPYVLLVFALASTLLMGVSSYKQHRWLVGRFAGAQQDLPAWLIQSRRLRHFWIASATTVLPVVLLKTPPVNFGDWLLLTICLTLHLLGASTALQYGCGTPWFFAAAICHPISFLLNHSLLALLPSSLCVGCCSLVAWDGLGRRDTRAWEAPLQLPRQ